MKRRRQPPDNRLDWCDPNMPVFVRAVDDKGIVHIIPVAPEKVQQFYAAKLRDPFYTAPHYKDDSSYWWNRKERK